MREELAEHEGYTNLSLADAIAAFDSCEKAMRPSYSGWEKRDVPTPMILHEGVWKVICRTDDIDNVATGRDVREDQKDNAIACYRKLIRLGARFSPTIFACIDTFSDG